MMKIQYLHDLTQNANHLGSNKHAGGKLGCKVGANPVSGSRDQLVIGDREVIWYQGLDPCIQTVRKVYSTETTILQAFWCNFAAEEDDMGRGIGGGAKGCGGVCIREQECLGLYMENGTVHYVPLPFEVKEVWPLDAGLIVERLIGAESAYDGLPTLFSLLHPMDDFSPITCRRPAVSAANVCVLGFFGEPGVRVLDLCAEATPTPLLLTYNTSTQQYSIGALLPATSEDIPSHLTTPQKPHLAVTTPTDKPLPISLSDSVSHGNEATPSVFMHTPVEMILSTCKRRPKTDKLKLPVLTQLQQQHAVESSGGCDPQSSGRSPFICRLQTPAKEAFLKKCSKSLSPTSMSRMSPFSQTVDSRSWSTLYSDEMSYSNKFEPLYPQLCLHSLWTSQTQSSDEHDSTGAHMIYTRDLVGCGYVGVVIPATSTLWLIRCTREGQSLKLVSAGTISCVEAVSLFSASLLLLLDCIGGLLVYSGPLKLGAVDLQAGPGPELGVLASPGGCGLSTSSAPTGVGDVVDTSFTLTFDPGTAMRCSLCPSPRHPVVELCLLALRQVLAEGVAEGVARAVLSHYCVSSWNLPLAQQLTYFTDWCTGVLGLSSSAPQQVTSVDMPHQFPALGSGVQSSVEDMETSSDVGGAEAGVCLVEHRHTVALALHLVYEELKLREREWCVELATLLLKVSSCLGWRQYMDHYQRDFPSLMQRPLAGTPGVVSAPPPPTPNIQQWLLLKLRNSQPPPFPVLPEVSQRTVLLVKLYSLLMCGKEGSINVPSLMTPLVGPTPLPPPDVSWASPDRLQAPPEQRVVLCLVDEGLTLSDLESLPVGVALPLLDCVQRCREAPPSDWSIAAYNMIGRQDISMTIDSNVKLASPTLEFSDDDDGMNLDLEVLKLRFSQDLRAREVRKMLQSAQPVRISIIQKPEVSDHDFIQQQETHLLALSQRTMAIPVGRGMFTLSTVSPVPTSPLSIPPLNLTGRAPPRTTTVSLDHVEKPPDMSKWAEFHNGVASGLRLASSSSRLNAAWIMFNRPGRVELTNSYAGFLMALGLTGHLAALQDYDLYTYLQEKHELTFVGVLLGVAASSCGKATPSLVSLLSLYFPPLLPPGSADTEISHLTQTAALLGIGLLHMGSANRHMAEMALEEIGHTPGPELEFAEDRESYSLTAGLTLGMVMLGLGGSAGSHLVDDLLLLMNGGHKREGMGRMPPGPSHLVMEGELVNTHVTAPGAISALGLMYLKTNDRTVAAMLGAPKTLYDLECIRPDFLLLRALCHGLVMWDYIEPTQSWIDQHIPPVVFEGLSRSVQSENQETPPSTSDLETLYQARAYITAGCCLAIGFRYAGTCDEKPYKCLLAMVRHFMGMSKGEELVGKHCAEQCLVTVLLGVAMVMSGSGDLQVMRVIRQLRVRVGHAEVTYGSQLATHMALGFLFLGSGRYTLSTSNVGVASLLCAVFPCFPGNSLDCRYHLQALRHLYVLAARPGVLVTRDMATGQARCVPLEVKVQGRGVREMVTPCLVQDWDKLEEITLSDSEFWPVTLKLGSDKSSVIRKSLSQSGLLYVQEKAMKKEVRVGSVALPLGGVGGCGLSSVRGKVILPHVEGALFQSGLPALLSHQESAGSKFLAASLLDCLQCERLLAFSSHLQMDRCIQCLADTASDHTNFLWQLKLTSAYMHLYAQKDTPTPWAGGRGSPLLSEDYIRTLELRVWHFLWQREEVVLPALRGYMGVEPVSEEVWSHSGEVSMALACILLWWGIPSPELLPLMPHSKLPDVFVMLQGLSSDAGAAVRLMPLLQSPPSPLSPFTEP